MMDKYKVMSKAGANLWHVEHFATEREARAYANECYMTGCNIIEIYVKTRHGYELICSHKEHWKTSVERMAEKWAEDAPYFC
jgi:hypothetical protein